MSRKMTTFQKILLHLLLIICVGMTIMPVVLVFFSSLKESSTLISTSLIPKFSELSLVNYKRLLTETPFLRWVWNTVVVSALSSVIAIIVTALAGYAFSRFKFFGRKNGLMAMILLQMFPAAMAMVAIFSMLQHLGDLTGGLVGLDSLLGLALVYIGAGIPFNTWMIKGYVDSLPKELEESALIDGAGTTKTFTRIILPLMGPILAVVAIFNFISPYSDFIFPSVVIFDESKYTLAVGMQSFISGNFSTNWSLFTAGSILGAIPIMVLFFVLQGFLVEGLTKGAVKG
ncbi:TPA: sugar ABC transporter permease [bacterium UBP9_UBA11836]|nr:sugar ABC transporter permease [bacterium UBP9_UBA11836]